LKLYVGLGTGDGLNGWNCRHTYYPFVLGVSERTYTDEELNRMNAEENKKIVYEGKEYTKYEASQRQRYLETLMRKQRQDIKLLQEGEANEEDLINAKSKYRITMSEYVDFSDKMNLPQQRERIYSDGLKIRSVGTQKSEQITIIQDSSVEEAEKTAKKFADDVSYNKIKNVDNLNKVNSTLADLKDKYPTKNLISITTDAKRTAAASSNYERLELNSTYFNKTKFVSSEEWKN
jgi:hypothetical protein